MIEHTPLMPSGQTNAWSPLDRGLPAEPPVDALYLHLPFCFHKCHYCDFFSVVERGDTDRQAAFTAALIAELTQRNAAGRLQPWTIFAGGGTPTLLRPPLWADLITALSADGLLDHVAEFTVEANPETVTIELMQQLAAGGVNRVSLGAQSFDRSSLKALERWHDPDNVPKAVDACRAAGLTNLSLDLIFGIPGQTLAMLERDLDMLLALRPTHLSTYGLTYEPQTALTARLRLGQVTAVDEDTERDMYALVLDRLAAAGYAQYEISNWAWTGNATDAADYRCQHNLAYWRNAHWLGLGPSAASHIAGHRWRNVPNLAAYLAQSPQPPIEDHEFLPPRRRVGEALMLGLRLNEGLDRIWLDEALADDADRQQAIREMVELGMLEWTAERLRLTRRGRFVADSVIAKLL